MLFWTLYWQNPPGSEAILTYHLRGILLIDHLQMLFWKLDWQRPPGPEANLETIYVVRIN